MTPEEIKKGLQEIQNKILNNTYSLWGSDLERTYEVSIMEDYDVDNIKYNGWYEELDKLIKKIS
jgi:hypothetical protein